MIIKKRSTDEKRSFSAKKGPFSYHKGTSSFVNKTKSYHKGTSSFVNKTKSHPIRQNVKNNSNNIRIIPLGGVEEIGKNMTAIEYKDDIVIIDAGFQFPDENHPGVDYIVPNTTYLEERKDRIRGIIISHGHLDHVGGLPYIIGRIGNPTIYTAKFSKVMILKRFEEFRHLPTPNIVQIDSKSKIPLGKDLKAKFFNITHGIPDAIGVIIETAFGNILYPGDFKIEHDGKGNPVKKELEVYEALGKENNLLLLMESTNIEREGFSFPEAEVQKNLEKYFKSVKGRIITSAFASSLERLIEIVKIAEKLGRKVVIDGRSLETNFAMAMEIGYAKFKKGTIISTKEIENYPPEKILAISTGAQGEEFGGMMRMANKRHKYITIHKGDTVFLSSSIVPGNELSVQALKDNLARQGAKVIHYGIADIHSSGHAYREEHKLMHKMLKPKFFIPIHGFYIMLATNAELVKELGMPEKSIVVPQKNGIIIEVSKNKIETIKEQAPSNLVMVDGLGVGDVQEVVLRDRQALAQDGIFVIIAQIDSQTGKVKNSPDIISRGFVYLKESQELLRSTRYIIRKTIEDITAKMHPVNMDYVKNNVREKVAEFLFKKTRRRPMVLPVLLEV